MTRQPKSRGSNLKKLSETLTAHSKSGSSPKDITDENLCANSDEVVTISGMPASKEYIKALQIKRLEQSRPKVKLPKPATPEATNLSYLFKDLEIAKSSTADVITPLAVTTTTLDDGRIYLKDAIKYFGWNEVTCLDFQVDSGASRNRGKVQWSINCS